MYLRTAIVRLYHSGSEVRLRNIVKMSKVFVRSIPEEERIQISLNYSLTNSVVKTINLDRLKCEELGKALTRLSCGILKHANKKTRKKKLNSDQESVALQEVEIKLLRNDTVVCNSTPNIEAWTPGSALQLLDQLIEIDYNPPTVTTLKLPKNIMAGFPIFPKIVVEFTDIRDCEFRWYRTGGACVQSKTSVASINCHDEDLVIATTQEYSPTTDDVGYSLKFVCTPKNEGRIGREAAILSDVQVTAGPGVCPFENRHVYTKMLAGDGSFRLVTYNILADLYADSEHTRTVLYPYCAPYALELDYRKQLLLKEIVGYNGDIICLQEVDQKVFEGVLQPVFSSCNFEGLLQLKGGEVAEGVAIFFRKSKFKLINQHNMFITDTMISDQVQKSLYDKVHSNEKLEETMRGRKTALQVTVLESLENLKKVCVANTHLYFHPEYPHIRLIQAIACVQHIEAVIQGYNVQGENVSVIFCGDLNSTPEHGVDSYMATGKISAEHPDWRRVPAEFVEGMDFSHSLQLFSACGYPEYSNYVGCFRGLLDYMYVDREAFRVSQVIPMPEKWEVTQFQALPSIVFPSDHIAQICDLAWKH